MDQSELKYAIRVDERAFFIRFYCWLYEADKSKVNFCKLFWAYVFAAPALLIRGLVGGVIILFRGLRRLGRGLLWTVQTILRPAFWLLDSSLKRRAERIARLKEEREAEEAEIQARLEAEKLEAEKEPEPKREYMQRGLGLVEHGGTLAIMKYKTALADAKDTAARATARSVNRIGEITSIPVVGRGILVVAACLGISAIGLSAMLAAPTLGSLLGGAFHGLGVAANATAEGTSYAANSVVHSEISFWAGLGLIGLAVLISAVMGAIAIGLPYLFVKYCLGPAGGVVTRAGAPPVRVLGGGLRGFGQAMHLGYYAVKTSTCPRIEIEERPDHEKIKELEKDLDLACL